METSVKLASLNPNPRPQRSVFLTTDAGIGACFLGIILSVCALVWKVPTEHLMAEVLATFGYEPLPAPADVIAACVTFGFFHASELSAADTVRAVFWFVGPILLCWQPLKDVIRLRVQPATDTALQMQLAFLVFELSMVGANLLPFLHLGAFGTLMLRFFFTALTLLALGLIQGFGICHALWDWYGAYKGKRGAMALALVASEVLCFGYAFVGLNWIFGWIGLILGSVVMSIFGWGSFKAGVPIGQRFFVLNMAFIGSGAFMFIWTMYHLPV